MLRELPFNQVRRVNKSDTIFPDHLELVVLSNNPGQSKYGLANLKLK
jgi:hypothetical protein